MLQITQWVPRLLHELRPIVVWEAIKEVFAFAVTHWWIPVFAFGATFGMLATRIFAKARAWGRILPIAGVANPSPPGERLQLGQWSSVSLGSTAVHTIQVRNDGGTDTICADIRAQVTLIGSNGEIRTQGLFLTICAGKVARARCYEYLDSCEAVDLALIAKHAGKFYIVSEKTRFPLKPRMERELQPGEYRLAVRLSAGREQDIAEFALHIDTDGALYKIPLAKGSSLAHA